MGDILFGIAGVVALAAVIATLWGRRHKNSWAWKYLAAKKKGGME